MKSIIFLAILLAPICLYSQDCKIERTVDEFTKQESINSEPIIIENALTDKGGNNYRTKFIFLKADDVVVLVAILNAAEVGTINEGETFYVKFKDESVLELKNLYTTISELDYNSMSKSYDHIYTLQFMLEQEQLLELSTKMIHKCRISSTKQYLSIETNDRLAKKAMGCASEFMGFIGMGN